jgi:hypothetical protein
VNGDTVPGSTLYAPRCSPARIEPVRARLTGILRAMAQLLRGTRHAEIDVASAIAALPTAMEWSPRTYPGRC